MISIASNWAGDAGREDGQKTDKIPLNHRVNWSLDNEEILISYADNPKVNQGWMKADSPWQFLAACIELRNFRVWQENIWKKNKQVIREYDFYSSLECYIDGSNNGSQHLSALTKDEVTAPHVNLVPLDLPGDLYKYVADNVWDHLKDIVRLYKITKGIRNDSADSVKNAVLNQYRECSIYPCTCPWSYTCITYKAAVYYCNTAKTLRSTSSINPQTLISQCRCVLINKNTIAYH